MDSEETQMTKVTTAMVIVGPSGLGPFHAPGWRVGEVLQLVEGGHAGPFWLHNSLGGRAAQSPHAARFVGSLDAEVAAASLIDAVGQAIGQPRGSSGPAERALGLAGRCRIGVVRLEAPTVLDDEALAVLHDWGLPVDVFASPVTAGNGTR